MDIIFTLGAGCMIFGDRAENPRTEIVHYMATLDRAAAVRADSEHVSDGPLAAVRQHWSTSSS